MKDEIVPTSNFISPVADLQQARERYQAVKDFIGSILVEGTDYGTVPGASEKKVLLKAGAEKMVTFFGFTTRFILADKVEDWTGAEHGGEPFFYYRFQCQLWRGDVLIAEGEGSCNSWEKKFRYRKAERVCPVCGAKAIIRGKAEFGGGWLCWEKRGGCKAKFPIGDPDIEGQEVGEVKNTDPAEQVNTFLKMAQKRALVAPVLIATNTSDYFTQDLDDFIDGEVSEKPQDSRPANVREKIKKEGMPLQPDEESMKASSTKAVALFESLTGLSTTEAAKSLLAHFKGGQMVSPRMIQEYAYQLTGLEGDGLEASRQNDQEQAAEEELQHPSE